MARMTSDQLALMFLQRRNEHGVAALTRKQATWMADLVRRENDGRFDRCVYGSDPELGVWIFSQYPNGAGFIQIRQAGAR